ncbi:hypothetical protein [Nostocoides sp. HKS02]|uniref:hypothetical protein n=1 Tax=Nostocoides sp. HKS02 TaxID=1813880 RepID=UPI00351B2F73
MFFAISGINFPIGVLLYWLTTNVWSMCQQFYVIRRMPAPGSPAEKAMQERHAKRGKTVKEFTVKGLDSGSGNGSGDGSGTDGDAPKPTGGQRQQPSRNKKRKGGAPKAAGSGGPISENKPQTDN